MSESTSDPWLEFTFDGQAGEAIDARAVGRLLLDVISAARQIAADLLRTGEPKGAMSTQERALAGFTIRTIGPGSKLRIELAPPVTDVAQQVSLGEKVSFLPSAELVIRQLEADLIGTPNGASPHRPKRRGSIKVLRRSLSRIGSGYSMGGTYSGDYRRIPIQLSDSKKDSSFERTERRVYFGRATMADSDPDHRRLRATLYDGRRFMLEVSDELPTSLADIFDRDLEFQVVDTIDSGFVVKSTVDGVRPLEPAEIGIDFPARDWRRLAAEQGIDLADRPDYAKLMRSLFDSNAEVEAFKHHIVASREGSKGDE